MLVAIADSCGDVLGTMFLAEGPHCEARNRTYSSAVAVPHSGKDST